MNTGNLNLRGLGMLLALALGAGCTTNRHYVPASALGMLQKDNATKLIGEGRLSHAPQYIELTMAVESVCFPTPLAASKANDQAVAKLIEQLKGRLDPKNSKDGVFSHGGYTRPYSRYSGGKTICNNTFQKRATVVMKSSRVKTFASDYQEIQKIVLMGAFRKPVAGPAQGATWASLGTPVPRLYYETRERLEQRALADALANARKKLAALAKGGCKPRVLKVVEQTLAGRRVPYGWSRRTPARGGAVDFDAIWVNKLLDVFFVIAPGSCKL